jgi:hypothetical protein
MGTREFRVSLSASPAQPVTVALAVGDTSGATVSPPSVFFDVNNFSAPRAITVTGIMDADALSENTVVTLTAPGYAAQTVAVMVVDDDVLEIDAVPSVSGVVFEGGTAMLQVTLSAQPPVPITVNAASNNQGKMTVAPASITYTPTNWNLNQFFTITGVEDPDLQNDSAILTLTATGLATKMITYNIPDND